MVSDVGGHELIVAFPDERAFDALYRMLQNNIGRLPIVSRENPQRMVGFLNRSSILSAWTRQIEEESVREHGWLDELLRTQHFENSEQRKTLVGKVTRLEHHLLQIEIAVEGKIEKVDFLLASPLPGISTGDHVKVSFQEANGNRVLERVEELRAH